MTRHVKTNDEAIDLAAGVISRLESVFKSTDTEIAFTLDMIKQKRAKGFMSSVEEEFYRKKIETFESNKPLIEADIVAVQIAREKLSNPFKAWSNQDRSKLEKLMKEQRLVIARKADQHWKYTGRFLHGFEGMLNTVGF